MTASKTTDSPLAHLSPLLQKRGMLTYLLATIVGLPTMSITLIAPAIPKIKVEFAATYNEAQLVLTGFLIAMAAGLLFIGLLSDRFGRRPILLSGLTLFFIGSLFGTFATSISVLVIARVLQGFGAAALMITGRIIVNDIYAAKDASRALSSITAVQSIVPVIALALGGGIVEFFGWRMTLIVMLVSSTIVLAQSYFLIPETNKNRLSMLNLAKLFEAFNTVLSSRYWQLYSLCAGLQIGMFYSMNGYMPYHFERLGASITAFGFYYATISVGYMIGNLINRRYGASYSLGQWVLIGCWICLATLIAILLGHSFDLLTPLRLSALISFIGFSHGLLVANAIISSMKNMGPHSGSANGLGAGMHMLIGAISGSLIISLGGATLFWVSVMVNILMAIMAIMAAARALKLSS